MLELLFYAVLIGVSASVYRNILLYTDALQWWVKIGQKYADKAWSKPIWFCDKCISGQLALWFIILNSLFALKLPYLNSFIYFLCPIIEQNNLNVLNGFILISMTILITTITSKLISLWDLKN